MVDGTVTWYDRRPAKSAGDDPPGTSFSSWKHRDGNSKSVSASRGAVTMVRLRLKQREASGAGPLPAREPS